MTHICQAADGSSSTAFPNKYVEDPWCWSEGTGFHRTSNPTWQRYPKQAKRIRQVGPDSISPRQAFRLGLGIGTGPGDIDAMQPALSLLSLTAMEGYAGDADLWAELGAAVRDRRPAGGTDPDLDVSFGRVMYENYLRTQSGRRRPLSLTPLVGTAEVASLFTGAPYKTYSWEIDAMVRELISTLTRAKPAAVQLAA